MVLLLMQKDTYVLDFECHGHTASVECVAFSQELGLLASCSWDKSIKLWDLNKRSKVVSKGTKRVKSTVETLSATVDLQEHSEPVTCVAFTGSKMLSASYDHSLRIWESATWTADKSINCEQCATCMDVQDGLIVCGYADGTLRVWDMDGADGSMLKFKADHGGWISSVKFSPVVKGKSGAAHMIATAGYNAQVKLWTMQAKTPVQTVTLERKLFAMDWQQQIAAGGEEGKLSLMSI
jgi:ribosome biogenesis protein YTM1